MKTERIHLIDAMRGLSLLGILVANVLIFQYGLFGKDEISYISEADSSFHTFLKIAVEGSFMPIFAFLFGFGMVKMQENLRRRNLAVKRTLAWRFFLLIGIGFLHAFYLWEGDILLSYGLTGLFLLLFLNRKAKTLLIWVIVLFAFTSLVSYGDSSTSLIENPELMNQYIENTNTINSQGTYLEIMDHRNNVDPFAAMGIPDELLIFIIVLAPLIIAPVFLFGMYGAKKGWFSEPIKQRSFYLKGAFLLPIGLVFKALYYLLENQAWTGVLFGSGSILLSIGYIFFFAYLYVTVKNSSIFNLFGYVGKLSLTNYLMQTIICTTVFYGYGLGLFGELGVMYGFLFSLVVYFAQVVCSKWYLSYFKTGPVERLIRMIIYLSISGRPKMKGVTPEKDNIGA
ncbi:DUF418 domain-containing protein [Salipaludibacillus neizhouensis]|nr:DUF418 domain-containing protein [Salipaludibacillus neizhouensis]